LGGYELIFPCTDTDRNEVYLGFVKRANEMWEEFTTGHKATHYRARLAEKTNTQNQSAPTGNGAALTVNKYHTQHNVQRKEIVYAGNNAT
jgi:hypothetical protein